MIDDCQYQLLLKHFCYSEKVSGDRGSWTSNTWSNKLHHNTSLVWDKLLFFQ